MHLVTIGLGGVTVISFPFFPRQCSVPSNFFNEVLRLWLHKHVGSVSPGYCNVVL